MKKKSEKWQEMADNADSEGARRYAERRAQAEREKESKEQDRLNKFWRRVKEK